MIYKVPTYIDTNKVFLINHSDIEGRFDSYFYLPIFKKLEDKLHELKCFPLSALINSITNGYDFRDYTDSGTPYLKVANVKQGELDFSKIQYVNFDSSQISKKIQLTKGNLLLTRKGTYGNAYSLKETCDFVISSEVFYIELRQDLISSDYLEIVLNSNIGQKQFDRNKIGAIMGSLSQEAVKQILIPVLSKDKQQQIVDIYNEAYILKQSKDNEAQNLLDSIDDYLLEELGIELPDSTQSNKADIPMWMSSENPLVKNGRLFVTSSREVIGQRLDPDYTLKIGFLNSLKSKYPFILMKDIMDGPPQYGANEESIDGNPDTDIRYIRITDIDEHGNLRPDTFRTAAKIENQYLLSENDLLFARSGATAGKCYIHKGSEKSSIFAGYLIRFRLNTDIALPDYVFHFCNSKLYAYWVSMIQRPSAQPNINSEEFKSLQIPLPPIEKQSEIANHITSTKQCAFELQKEAVNLLEFAKRQIEIMILGE